MAAIKQIGPVPQIGFGTYTHEGDEGRQIISWALEAGYRHIDTAQLYRNESVVGQAISESAIARDEIFLTTKIAPENFGPGQILGHVKNSLEKLRVAQVDLLLLHWPSSRFEVEDYVAQLAAVYDAGLVKHIGVSNFNTSYLDAAIRVLGNRPITTNQCEIHVLNQNHIIADYCKSQNIPMTAYSPLARGALTNNATLKAIGDRTGHTASQVGLAFLLHEGHVIIPASTNKTRMLENLNAKDIVLTPADMAAIRKLDEGRRLVTGAWAPKWDT